MIAGRRALGLAALLLAGMAGVQASPAQAKTDAISRGNKAFAEGDLRGALSLYEQAAAADTKAYEAVTLAGETETRLEEPQKAVAYYARAVAIDPNREAAYRLWGDALMKAADMKGAEEKFVEAILAEPYVKAPRQGLKRWADANHAHLSDPPIRLPARATVDAQGQVRPAVDPGTAKRPAAEAWAAYAAAPAAWSGREFHQRYPAEKAYRDSLAEEMESLRGVLAAVAAMQKDGRLPDGQLDPTLRSMQALDKDGMLESCVLLDHWDPGIAQDYPGYRAEHKDTLRAYMYKYVIHPAR
ncbi:hypothetical protein [Granulicella sibirica]|uniref:Uncharacterized protein n=1 Tax=Granulicella sibirica TaxID=2479048 RepID=A0A4Q0T9X2_9BACT|nr:hypothetical protein [Granulicella sibirica]RXH58849.1 hypothetical protein GRAN_2159 [Granulicella sibirica]